MDIIRECWKRGDFDHYPEGYDPTDPNKPKIKKVDPLYNKDLEFVQVSTESIRTEEIQLEEFYNRSSENPGSFPHSRHNRGESVRSSLDVTRDEMRNSHQLDNRYSVERARLSLDLPGVTRASTLLNGHD